MNLLIYYDILITLETFANPLFNDLEIAYTMSHL